MNTVLPIVASLTITLVVSIVIVIGYRHWKQRRHMKKVPRLAVIKTEDGIKDPETRYPLVPTTIPTQEREEGTVTLLQTQQTIHKPESPVHSMSSTEPGRYESSVGSGQTCYNCGALQRQPTESVVGDDEQTVQKIAWNRHRSDPPDNNNSVDIQNGIIVGGRQVPGCTSTPLSPSGCQPSPKLDDVRTQTCLYHGQHWVRGNTTATGTPVTQPSSRTNPTDNGTATGQTSCRHITNLVEEPGPCQPTNSSPFSSFPPSCVESI